MFYIYFAQSLVNNKVYVGSTTKLPQIRITEHNNGSNIWTKHNGKLKLIYFEKYHCKKDVKCRELYYKSGFGRKVKKLIVDYLSSVSATG